MKKHLLNQILFSVAITFFASAVFAYDYQITEIETLGGNRNEATDINDLGYVVGSSDTEFDQPHAFLWINGKTIALPFRSANHINNKNQVVGLVDTKYAQRAVLWTQNKFIQLDDNGQSDAIGINDNGHVVGTYTPSHGAHWNATLWIGQTATDLSPIKDRNSIAYGINNKGTIVGFSNLTANNYRHATMWSNGKVILLDSLEDNESEAVGVNNNDQVVGNMRKHDGVDYAMLWSDGKATVLGKGNAFGINDKGQIVGSRYENVTRAMMWENGVQIELNSLIDPNLGWRLVSARAINNSGMIVGVGYLNGYLRAFLLTPSK